MIREPVVWDSSSISFEELSPGLLRLDSESLLKAGEGSASSLSQLEDMVQSSVRSCGSFVCVEFFTGVSLVVCHSKRSTGVSFELSASVNNFIISVIAEDVNQVLEFELNFVSSRSDQGVAFRVS